MSNKFSRKYLFEVGKTKITDLRLRFNIEYALAGFIPICEIDIYNLSITTINEVLIAGTPFTFRAGYENNYPILFQGEIRNVFSSRNDVDVITNILSGGLDHSLREKRISKTLDNPKNVLEIIQDYLSNVDISIGDIKIKNKPVIGSYSTSSQFVHAMNKLSNEFTFNWYIYNNLFYAYDNELYPNRNIYRISQDSGLLDTPVLTDLGIDVRMLLEPGIRPQDRYEVVSNYLSLSQDAAPLVAARVNVKGRQSVLQVRHIGDTHNDMWYTELRGIKEGSRANA